MSTSMTLNGVLLPIDILNVEGRGPVSVETTYATVSGRHGSLPVRRRFPTKEMNVDFVIRNLTTNKVDELNRLLVAGLEMPVTFSDELGRTYYASLNGDPEWEQVRKTGMGTLPFTRQPFKYGAEKTTSGLRVTNTGNFDMDVTVKASFGGAASEYKITHPNGGFVRVIYGFVGGDKLEIDIGKRKVKINGNVQQATYDWHSRPFTVAPGVTDLVQTTAGNPSVQITFRERWL